MNRLAVTTAGFLIVALLSAAVASAKKPGPHGHKAKVACTQAALVAAIAAANTDGGGTLSLAHGCDYQLTVSPDSSENGLPAITPPITIRGNHATIDGTNSFRVFEVDGPGGNLAVRQLTITGGSVEDIGGGVADVGGAVGLNHTQVTGNSAGAAGGGAPHTPFSSPRR